jgi:nitrous oxidase accessory protein NosD
VKVRQIVVLAAPAVLAVLAGGLLAGASWGRAAVDDPLCGTVVTTSLTLHATMRCMTKPGLVVGASKITIDLNGFTIEGAATVTGDDQTGIGIKNVGFDRVKIENGTIADFKFGILVQDGATENTVENVKVLSNALDGLIAITGSDGLSAKNVRAVKNGAIGISLSDSVGHTIDSAYATGNAASGVKLVNTPGVKLSNSVATLNGESGILVQGATGGLSISKVVAARNHDIGIFLNGDGVDGAKVQDVSLSANVVGLWIDRADGALVQRAAVSGSFSTGLVVAQDADGARLSQVTATGNVAGLFVEPGSDGVLVTGSTISGNATDGILIKDDDAVLKANRADGNGARGIVALLPLSDGGKNAAHGNLGIDCLNVHCER